jgi:hypothetical protein
LSSVVRRVEWVRVRSPLRVATQPACESRTSPTAILSPRSRRSLLTTDLRLDGSDGGAGVIAVVCTLAVTLVGAFGLITLTRGALEAARARTAADLGALATVNWGPAVGAYVVLVNGGELVEIERTAFSASAEVRVGQAVVGGRAALVD